MLSEEVVAPIMKKLWLYYYKCNCDRQILHEQTLAFIQDCKNLEEDLFLRSCRLARSRSQFFPTTRDVLLAARELTIRDRQSTYYKQQQMEHTQDDIKLILECIDAKIEKS